MKWLKSIAVAALSLYLCVLPIQAERVDAVVKQVVPIDGMGAVASMACTQVVPQNEEGVFPLYVEFYDLAQDLWLEVKCEGNTLASTPLTTREGMASAWITLENPGKSQSLSFFFLDQPEGEPIYQSVAMVLGFLENLSFDDADAMACTPVTNLSVASKEATILACLPWDTEDPAKVLYGQMVDEQGNIYGTASQPAEIGDCTMPDSRFRSVYRENPYEVLVQGLKTRIELSQMPEPGNYDLVFVDAFGAECYRFPDAIQCDDRPVAQLMGWTAVPGDGATYGEVTLYLANGAPEDFALELYQGTTLVGQSQGFCALEYDRQTGGVYLSYSFALEQPLTAGTVYTATIKTEVSHHGESARTLWAVRAQSGTIYPSASCFDSAYFANVLLKTQGFVPQRQYKAVLAQAQTALAECLVTTDEQGLFDISFTDRQDNLIPVTPGQTYDIVLYCWQSGGQWALVDEIQLVAGGEEATPTESKVLFAQATGLPVERILVNDRISLVNGDLPNVRLQLFGQQNQTTQPDFSEVLTNDFTITDEDAALFSAQRYRAVTWQDNRIIGVDPDGYWVNAQCMADFQFMQEIGIPNFEIQIAPTEHGTVQLFGDNGTPVNHEDWLNFAEIYVHALPDAGYVLDEILVNDKPIDGRAFLLAENTRVRATFKPRQVERFAIDLRHGEESDTSGGLFQCAPESAALGDLVTLTAQPSMGFWLMGVRVLETETGLEVPVSMGEAPNTWQFEMPGTPVAAEVTFMAKAFGEIIASYDITAGTVLVPGYAWEGEQVTVTVRAYEGCTLEELWLAYDLAGQERTENLLAHPGEAPDTYCFTMPATQMVWIRPVFREHLFTISLPDPAPAGGRIVLSHTSARPGTWITITAIPDANHRLMPGSVGVRGEDQTAIPLTKTERPLTWSFTMPWQNVQVSATFEGTAPEIVGSRAEQLGVGQMKLTVQVKNATPAVSLAAALYDQAGRLLDVQLVPCTSGAESQEIILSYNGAPVSGRIFLLKTDGLMPLSHIVPIALPQ